MNDKLRWAVLALAQPADVQIRLFPRFVEVADELASSWEEAIEALSSTEGLSEDQRTKIELLDQFILSFSGQENLHYWQENSLYTFVEWEQVRHMAKDIAESFGWPLEPPSPSDDIYISGSG